jgi:hypothetical protein
MSNDLPEIHFGTVEEQPVDWREEVVDEDDSDDDAPASKELIAMLGFNPDEYKEETEDVAPSARTVALRSLKEVISGMRSELGNIQTPSVPIVSAVPQSTNVQENIGAPAEPAVNSGNTGGIVYKSYSIKQDLKSGGYGIYSVGGVLIGQTAELPLAIARIDEISIKGSE